jgi:hypothetical protein
MAVYTFIYSLAIRIYRDENTPAQSEYIKLRMVLLEFCIKNISSLLIQKLYFIALFKISLKIIVNLLFIPIYIYTIFTYIYIYTIFTYIYIYIYIYI